MRDASFSNNEWVIIIGLTGELKGQVLICFDIEAVLDIASKMCMMPITQMDDLSCSAICELGNMILGNAATLFASDGMGIDNFTKNLCVPLFYDGGSKRIEIHLSIKG